MKRVEACGFRCENTVERRPLGTVGDAEGVAGDRRPVDRYGERSTVRLRASARFHGSDIGFELVQNALEEVHLLLEAPVVIVFSGPAFQAIAVIPNLHLELGEPVSKSPLKATFCAYRLPAQNPIRTTAPRAALNKIRFMICLLK